MAKVKHLTVSLENQPGRLAAVAKALADAKVNTVAVLGSAADLGTLCRLAESIVVWHHVRPQQGHQPLAS